MVKLYCTLVIPIANCKMSNTALSIEDVDPGGDDAAAPAAGSAEPRSKPQAVLPAGSVAIGLPRLRVGGR